MLWRPARHADLAGRPDLLLHDLSATCSSHAPCICPQSFEAFCAACPTIQEDALLRSKNKRKKAIYYAIQ